MSIQRGATGASRRMPSLLPLSVSNGLNGQSEVQLAEMVPGASLGQLTHRLAKRRTRFRGPPAKQGRHATVEKHRHARWQIIPLLRCGFELASLPGQSGSLIGPGVAPPGRYSRLVGLD